MLQKVLLNCTNDNWSIVYNNKLAHEEIQRSIMLRCLSLYISSHLILSYECASLHKI